MSIAVSSSIVATPERVAQPPVHRNELMSVQALRGIAVLIVLAVHVEDMANRLPAFAHLHSWYAAHFGYSGPDLFFVISGFIMSYITMGQPFRPRNWLASRFIRIYPMYFIFTALAFTIYLVRPDQPVMGSGPHDAWTIVGSFMILPQRALPLLFVGWTVQHEVVFYTIVFLVAATLPRRWLIRVLGVLSLVAFGHWVMINHYGLQDWPFSFPSLYLWQFFAGALVYRFRDQTRRVGVYGAGALALAFLTAGALFAESGTMGGELPLRVVLFGAGYASVLVAFLNHEERQKASGAFDPSFRSFTVRLGDASYSIYLAHPFILAAFGHTGRWLDLSGAAGWAWLPLSFITVIVVGMTIYTYLEKPVLVACRRLLISRPVREAAK